MPISVCKISDGEHRYREGDDESDRFSFFLDVMSGVAMDHRETHHDEEHNVRWEDSRLHILRQDGPCERPHCDKKGRANDVATPLLQLVEEICRLHLLSDGELGVNVALRIRKLFAARNAVRLERVEGEIGRGDAEPLLDALELFKEGHHLRRRAVKHFEPAVHKEHFVKELENLLSRRVNRCHHSVGEVPREVVQALHREHRCVRVQSGRRFV
mmetsp:Transcript_8370/g.27822  ORF Transcript_8370/g.27822 Transcript_8370/m.27822 type:complete len:214 (-) Transcript_8370:597-1238(-)